MIFTGGPGLKIARLIYHLPNFFRLFRALWKDPRIPIYQKAVPVFAAVAALLVAAAYFFWRIDLVFDFLPVVGKLDDILIAGALLVLPAGRLFMRVVPPEILAEHVADIADKR